MNELAQEYEQELQETRSEYEQRIEYLETQIERLQRTNLKILEQRDTVTDLEVYVDEQRDWNEAGLLTRAKWRLFGKDGDESRAASSTSNSNV